MQEEEVGVEEGQVVRIGRRCFVGNLAWKTSWQDLKDKFRSNGNVVYANVMREDDGKSRGWGIVEFESPEEALDAINTQNGTDLGGRPILVREDREDRDVKQFSDEPRPPREPRAPRAARGGGRGDGGRGRGDGGGRGGRGNGPPPEQAGESSGLQIVVQGIPWSYTWKELKDMFQSDDIERADVAMGSDGRSRGFGTVKFSSAEAAQAAIDQWHEQDLDGRRCAVFLDKYA
ncbi:hypothetical protein FOA52_015570 [Chlamydomonas sp. UWO 241]|nr:hypothetical protein FOA52_015570 [Chlamydomonas sp. UWO 241]